MAPRAHDDTLRLGGRQGGTLLVMAAAIAAVGMLVSWGLQAWAEHAERADREALQAAMAPGLPAWTTLEQEHGFSNAPRPRRNRNGSPGPDAEGRGHWLRVTAHAARAPSSSARGVLLTLDEAGDVVIDEAHRNLPDRVRADDAEDVGWVAFVRLSRLEEAYFFETSPVAIERLEARLVSLDGELLASAEAESLPPSFVPRELGPPDALPLPSALTVRLTRRMVDAAAPRDP